MRWSAVGRLWRRLMGRAVIVRFNDGSEQVMDEAEAQKVCSPGPHVQPMGQIVGVPDVGRGNGKPADKDSPYLTPQLDPLGLGLEVTEVNAPATLGMVGPESGNQAIMNPDPWYSKAGGPPTRRTIQADRTFLLGDTYDDVAAGVRYKVVRPGRWTDDEETCVVWAAQKKIVVDQRTREVRGEAAAEAKPSKVTMTQAKVDAEVKRRLAVLENEHAAEKPGWAHQDMGASHPAMPSPESVLVGSATFQKQLRYARIAALKKARRLMREARDLTDAKDRMRKPIVRAIKVLKELLEVEQ